VNVKYDSWQSVTTNDKGVWTADFAESFDITKGGIQAEIPDDDGDRTVVK
jgi:hypothetical protein